MPLDVQERINNDNLLALHWHPPREEALVLGAELGETQTTVDTLLRRMTMLWKRAFIEEGINQMLDAGCMFTERMSLI